MPSKPLYSHEEKIEIFYRFLFTPATQKQIAYELNAQRSLICRVCKEIREEICSSGVNVLIFPSLETLTILLKRNLP